MKKVVVIVCVAALIATLVPVTSQALNDNRQPGGIPAFLVGCCFGIRAGTQWNEGADLHWREWSALIPYWNIVLGIWNGMECYNGAEGHDWAKTNGAVWY
jgi:hypothetical protein